MPVGTVGMTRARGAMAGAGLLAVLMLLAGTAHAASALRRSPFGRPLVASKPVIAGLEPRTVWSTGGGEVVVEGENLEQDEQLFVGDQEAEFEEGNSTYMVFYAPPEDRAAREAGGTARVALTTIAGTDEPDTGGEDVLTYTPAPLPRVDYVLPESGGGGTTVEIVGEDFKEGPEDESIVTGVDFGSKPATRYEVLSPTRLEATAPPGGGVVEVTVTTGAGTSPSSAHGYFTYETTRNLEVTGVEPGAGPLAGGNTVTIDGEGFTHTTGVHFGAVEASSFKVESDKRLTAVAPPGTAGVVDVTVTVASPSATTADVSADRYTYVPAPVITAVTPTRLPDHGTAEILISGEDLGGLVSAAAGGETVHLEDDTATSVKGIVDYADSPGVSHIILTNGVGESNAPTAASEVVFESTPVRPREPALGRCTAVAKNPETHAYDGAYKEAKCEKTATGHAGKYEWEPGLAHDGVTLTAGAITMESNAGEIACTGAVGNGHVEGAAGLADVTLTFSGCEREGEACASGATAGQVQTRALQGVVGWVNYAKSVGGIALMPVAFRGVWAQATCGSHTVTLTGGLPAEVKTGKPSSSLKLSYAAKAGKPKLRGLEEIYPASLSGQVDEGPGAGIATTATITLTAEEPLELNEAL